MNFMTTKPTEFLDFLLPLSLSHHDFNKISLELFSTFTEQCVFCGYLFGLFVSPTVLSLSSAWLTHIKISECLVTSNFKLDKEVVDNLSFVTEGFVLMSTFFFCYLLLKLNSILPTFAKRSDSQNVSSHALCQHIKEKSS